MVVYYNSQVVTNQVNGNCECKGKQMKKYLEQVKKQTNDLQVKFVQIPREENELSCQDCINRAYAHPQSGTIICSDLTINRWHQYVGDRFQKQLDYTINLLLEKRHVT